MMRLSFLAALTPVSGAPVWEQACSVRGEEQAQREAVPAWELVCFQVAPEQRASRAEAEALGEPVRHEFQGALLAAPEQSDSLWDGWELGLPDGLLSQAG